MCKYDRGYVDSGGNEHIHKGIKLRGWFAPDHKRWYRRKVKEIKNGTIVEIGVYGGASMLSIVDICIENKIKIYGVDPWEKIVNVNGEDVDGRRLKKMQKQLLEVHENLKYIIKRLGYNNIQLIQGLSNEGSVLNNFADESIDMLFVDGNHSYESVLSDLNLWFPKLKKDGKLIGHDWKWKSVRMAVKEFCKKHSFEVESEVKNTWEILK